MCFEERCVSEEWPAAEMWTVDCYRAATDRQIPPMHCKVGTYTMMQPHGFRRECRFIRMAGTQSVHRQFTWPYIYIFIFPVDVMVFLLRLTLRQIERRKGITRRCQHFHFKPLSFVNYVNRLHFVSCVTAFFSAGKATIQLGFTSVRNFESTHFDFSGICQYPMAHFWNFFLSLRSFRKNKLDKPMYGLVFLSQTANKINLYRTLISLNNNQVFSLKQPRAFLFPWLHVHSQ